MSAMTFLKAARCGARHLFRPGVALAGLLILTAACSDAPADPTAERNKLLVRQMLQEMDGAPGTDITAKWMTSDYRLVLNGTAIDLAGYREMALGMKAAFTDLKHDIHHIVAEGDSVAVGITFRAKHIGPYEGIAATGRTIAIEELVVLQFRDDKVVSEWAVVDLAAVEQQLTKAG
jgi:predicted ester cyclase